MITRYLLALLIGLLMASAHAQVPPKPQVISIEMLEQMFSNIRAKTKWNVDGELLWGYFFFDPSPEKLRALADELSTAGYRVVGIYPANGKPKYVLHIEKVEHHTPQSLYARNQAFYALSEARGVESYDGMDVGAVPQGKAQ